MKFNVNVTSPPGAIVCVVPSVMPANVPGPPLTVPTLQAPGGPVGSLGNVSVVGCGVPDVGVVTFAVTPLPDQGEPFNRARQCMVPGVVAVKLKVNVA